MEVSSSQTKYLMNQDRPLWETTSYTSQRCMQDENLKFFESLVTNDKVATKERNKGEDFR